MTPIPSLTTFQCYLFLIMAAVFCFIRTSRLKPMFGMTAWTDLRRSLIDSAVSDLRGVPRSKTVGAKTYWYDHFRVGNKTWRWRQSNRQTLVEFLTPSFEGDEGIRDLPALGVNAQSLHFLDYLIAGPTRVSFLYRSGVLVQVPRPERFAIHKLIVADRRQGGPDALKAHKDRAQAAFLIDALSETRPDDLIEAYQLAIETGPAWRTRILASLQRMPATAELLQAMLQLHTLDCPPRKRRQLDSRKPTLCRSSIVRWICFCLERHNSKAQTRQKRNAVTRRVRTAAGNEL
ncbi:hypothetical protein ACSSV1_005278 [Labrenzia sp. MBR-25]